MKHTNKTVFADQSDQKLRAASSDSSEQPRKLTRRERNALNREKKAAVEAAVLAADRLRAGQQPTAAQLSAADPAVLAAELKLVRAGSAENSAPQAAGQAVAVSSVGKQSVEGKEQPGTVEDAVEAVESCTTQGSEASRVCEGVVTVKDSVQQPATRGRGRPSTYTEETAIAICEWIQSGKSLNRWLQEHGGNAATIYAWVRERPDFARAYAQAHEDRADTLVDEMIAIADDAADCSDIAMVQAAKLRIDTRRWIAQKMRPARYGDNVLPNGPAKVLINIGIPPRNPTPIDQTPVQVVASD